MYSLWPALWRLHHTHKHHMLLSLSLIPRGIINRIACLRRRLPPSQFLSLAVAASVIKNANWEWQSNREFHHWEIECNCLAKIHWRESSVVDWTLWYAWLCVTFFACFLIGVIYKSLSLKKNLRLAFKSRRTSIFIRTRQYMIHNKSVRNETHRAVSHLSTDAWTPISIDRWTNPKPISHSRLNPTDPCTYICANAHAWIGASACTCVFQNPAASTHCLTQSYTAALLHPPQPPTSLPPGALRQRAEWSRAVCGDSDIHRMQWIINEHHLVHTTGEHCSNRLLHDVSLSPSLSLSSSVCHSFIVSLTCPLTLPLPPLFPHILPLHSHRRAFSHHLVVFLLRLHLFALFCSSAATPHATRLPLWQASHGIPHSNSAVQFPGS